jgi:phosphate transport system protein
MLRRSRTGFDQQFSGIRDGLIAMGEMVDRAIGKALQALLDHDAVLAREVITGDQAVNELRYKIEEDCLVLIATQQPAAGNLRAVVAAMHMVVELERMADHAATIAKTVLLMDEKHLSDQEENIVRMGETSRKMLGESIQAFLNKDAEWARKVAEQDDIMDELFREVFDQLLRVMRVEPEKSTPVTRLLWVAHYLERIADRVTNLAERVVFMTTGDIEELD